MNKLVHKFAVIAFVFYAFTVSGYSQTLNVRDFGAKGDGKSDDTVAIQKAVNTAFKAQKGIPTVRGQSKGARIITKPVVVIPAGIYIISDTILMSGAEMVLRGEGNPIIDMTDDAKDIIYTSTAWRMRIEGITFQHGAIQLRLHNQNLDSGQIVIEHCRFYNATRKAIEIDARSIAVYVEHCIFDRCEQVLTTVTDMATMRSSWITSSRTMADNSAVIETYGEQFLFEDMVLVPLVHGTNQRWIDNYGLKVICRATRFGGEGGGFTPVYNFAKPRKGVLGSSVIVENSWICANSSYSANCAVYCKEVPNMIVVRNNDLVGSKPVIVDNRVDLERYFYGFHPEQLHFEADGNVGMSRDQFPDLLKKPVCLPLVNVGLNEAGTISRFHEAAEQVRPFVKQDATGLSLGSHAQKTNTADFVQVNPNKHGWDLNEFMDDTTVPNAAHLKLAPWDSDILMMRRTDSAGTWPHVAFGPVEFDLDIYPWITWKLKDMGDEKHPGHAVKVIDVKTGTMVTVAERDRPPYYDYQGADVKKLLGVTGKRKLIVRFYYFGNRYANKTFFYDKAGQFLLIDFIRFEKD